MPVPLPTILRSRASRLRRLAATIEDMPAMHLDRHAGVDTWHGRRPSECLQLIWSAQHRIHEAADDLRMNAWLLEQRADDVESAARIAQQTV